MSQDWSLCETMSIQNGGGGLGGYKSTEIDDSAEKYEKEFSLIACVSGSSIVVFLAIT